MPYGCAARSGRQLGRERIPWHCGVLRFEGGDVVVDRHGGFLMLGSAAPIAAFVATKAVGRAGPAPRSEAEAAGAKRRMAGADYFASRCKGGLARRRKIVGHPPFRGRTVCI